MPPLDPQHIVYFICIGVFTLLAAWSDLRRWKIPNAMTLPMFVAGLVYQVSFHGWAGLLDGLLAFLIGFTLFFVFWMMGLSGGGDVKLVGALTVWLGRKLLFPVFVMMTVFVLVIHLSYMFYRLVTGGFRQVKKDLTDAKAARTEPPSGNSKFIAARHKGRTVVGYAIPVLLAVWSVLLWKLPQL